MAGELDADEIFELGTWLGHLEADTNLEKPEWTDIREDLQNICRYKSTKGLEFIGSEAQGFLSSFGRKYKDKSKKIEDDDVGWLQTTIQIWYGRITEISKKWILCLPQTQLDISKLSSGAKPFFKEEEWNVLTELEKQGMNEAATSFIGNNFTASEFMALRTVESILRRWYEKKTGNKIGKVIWGKVLDKIEKEFPEKKRPIEISALFHLRRRRNAIAHPEAISNESDASVTFIYVIDVCKAVKSLLLPQT
ncbi:MAG: hypothetical protein L6N96_03005 [Candidatus Methylarchaceae archaeon HK02M2]|nr:hypothetical protein [Candidatus Methylarchaceae archaeon HK02M2]